MAETRGIYFTIMVLFTALNLSILRPCIADSSLHNLYNEGDAVPLFVNKIGPLNNPSETYQYYDLPFCDPDQLIPKKETLGEILNGDRLTNTLYDLRFQEKKVEYILCEKKLNRDDITKFRNAVNSNFYFPCFVLLWALGHSY